MRFTRFRFFVLFCAVGAVSGCSTMQESQSAGKPYYTIQEPLQCVPYTREISGIQIFGNAHTWWPQAQGKYPRSGKPKVGAVMVLSRTSRNPHGHLAVVKRIVDSRTIEVTHSNWGSDRQSRSIIYKQMPVKDVSSKNDWSEARFFHYPAKTFGRVYPVSGFIYPE